MNNAKDSEKMVELAIKQNLLLWQISQSLLEIDEKLDAIINPKDDD